MYNLSEKDWEYETILAKYNSKHYQNKSRNGFGDVIVVEAAVGQTLHEKLNCFNIGEMDYILREQLRVNLNMVKCTPEELVKMDFVTENFDPFQSIKVLGGQSIADFFLKKPREMDKFIERCNSPEGSKFVNTLIDSYLK